MKKIKPGDSVEGKSGGAPLGWKVRESSTKEVAFERMLNFKNRSVKGTAPTEAEMSSACLRNRKVTVAGEWGVEGGMMVAVRSDRRA